LFSGDVYLTPLSSNFRQHVIERLSWVEQATLVSLQTARMYTQEAGGMIATRHGLYQSIAVGLRHPIDRRHGTWKPVAQRDRSRGQNGLTCGDV
jgi:hypothetical protein